MGFLFIFKLLTLALSAKQRYSSTMSSAEYIPRNAAETLTNAQEVLEAGIEAAGSLSQYLRNIEREQAQSTEGKVELLRLRRIARMMTNPLTGDDTLETQAFYDGALLSSALLVNLSNPKKFQGGAFAHELYHYRSTELHEAHDTLMASPLERMAITEMITEGLQEEVYTWPYEEYENPKLQDFIEEQLLTTYEERPEGNDPFTHALTGFWMPFKEFHEPAFMDETLPLLRYVDDTLPDEFFENLASARISDQIDEVMEEPSFLSVDKECALIMQHFNKLQAGFASISTHLPDELAAYSLLLHNEQTLNTLNRNNEIFTSEDILKVNGVYFCTLKEGDEQPTQQKVSTNTEVLGRYQSIAIIDVPVLQDFNHPNTGSTTGLKQVRQQKTAAIIIENPTFIVERDGEQEVTPTEDTTIAIPLIYKSAHISRLA